MNVVKPLVKLILERSISSAGGGALEWTLQGFGMLRTYLAPELRLHVWDSRYRASGVSELHTHPWHFHSCVVAGRVVNKRYREVDLAGTPMQRQTILCGEGGGLVDEKPALVCLTGASLEVYEAGDSYSQAAHEIHKSMPEPGTVTIVQREFLDDADHAHVYWPVGEEWGTAEPRLATQEEVESICGLALNRWFDVGSAVS